MKQFQSLVVGLSLFLASFAQAADVPQGTVCGFPADAAVYSGQFSAINGTTGGKKFTLRRFTGIDSTAELVVTGTALTIACYAYARDTVEAQVDGGAWTDITPLTYQIPTATTVFAGLPDAPHAVSIRARKSVLFSLDCTTADCFMVRGEKPAIVQPLAALGSQYIVSAATPDALGRPGILNNLRVEAGYGLRQLRGYDALQPQPQRVGATDGDVLYTYGALFRFRASIRELALWTYLDGSKYALVVDGVLQPAVSSPVLYRWGWLTLSTTLQPAKAREYAVVAAFFPPAQYNAGSGCVYALRTRGGKGVDTNSQPARRPLLACYGDSITGNQISIVPRIGLEPSLNDATQGWIFRLGQSLAMSTVNLGIGSTVVHDFSANLGNAPDNIKVYLTTNTGEARTGNITGLTPPPAKVVILYGTNDMGQAFVPYGAPGETLAEFHASYATMMRKIAAGLPAATDIYCIGILPRFDYPAAEIARWNEAIKACVEVLKDSRVHYVDPGPWRLAGASGKDFKTNFLDGLHPNPIGKAIMAKRLHRILTAK